LLGTHQLECTMGVPMDPYELQERQRLAEEAAEKVMRDVPRIRVEELISDGDNGRPTTVEELDADLRIGGA
jgi:hypothetical protein